ncbi:TlpA family protein disulfide reductase [Marinilongibacter aquaticus]|uniref:TlpA family protein disulfide reductase n=1 Tax=Marinilongibacter aquaticus TaxID=2975157 RepID=UPI0021BDDA6F|nr:TlpA disulfide reductase family protein [Marinilongibacter aquaticus]UBM58946.1 TlpA family protein disulfide reductase [Marinilongibacter aquaticus]
MKIYFRLVLFLLIGGYSCFAQTENIFSVNPNEPYLEAAFSKEKELNVFLNQYAEFVKEFSAQFKEDFNTDIQYKAIMQTEVDAWEMHLFSARNAQMQFVKNYDKASPLSSAWKNLVVQQIDYNYWHLLLAYAVIRGNENDKLQHIMALPSIMLAPLGKKNLDSPTLLISKSFRQFLPYYIIYLNSEKRKFQKYSDGQKSMSDKIKLAEEYLKDDRLDYTKAELLAMYHKSLNVESFQFWVSQINDIALQRYLKDQFFDLVLQNEKKQKATEEEEKTKLPVIMDLEDKPFTFEKFKDKVIYVDFWASWCGPCHAEFPHSKMLYDRFSKKQKKEVVFLYVSVDKDLEKWKEAVKKFALESLGENGHSYAVSTAYLISSIPRYMIINKKGEVVHPNAPRPSNPETLGLLLELIN